MLCLSKTWGLEIPKADFSCLSRDQREEIADQFSQNMACHKELAKMVIPPPAQDEWTWIMLSFLAGIAGGVYGYKAVQK
jgi:hypothetical protein